MLRGAKEGLWRETWEDWQFPQRWRPASTAPCLIHAHGSVRTTRIDQPRVAHSLLNLYKMKKSRMSASTATTHKTPQIVAASADHKPIKIAHWSLCNGSGMHSVAKEMAEAEKKLGLDSFLINIQTDEIWEQALDADVHVSHTHIPVIYRGKAWAKQVTKPFKIVGCFHGTPEHVFEGSVTAGENGAYAPGNSLMIMQHDMKRSHARVTFWERHKAIYETMVPQGIPIYCVPMGVDRAFWADGASRGKYQGNPSVWTAENGHTIKWPLDLLLAWSWISEAVDEAYLHCCYVPFDQHRYWFPLVHQNGAYYRAHIGPWTYPHEELRRVLKSVDFVTSLVRYGDFNRLCLEAKASGAKVISYQGNEYADHWVQEGDQRTMAQQMIEILNGNAEPRKPREVADSSVMAAEMKTIYESIL